MRILKSIFLATALATTFIGQGTSDLCLAEAQSTAPKSDTIPARDSATSQEDISLTNRCIEGGKEKIYCLCVTKILKNEMNLREYRGAAALYQKQASKPKLIKKGYTNSEIKLINARSQRLTSENNFRTLCDEAETYFSAATED
jgi:hypothetical protein